MSETFDLLLTWTGESKPLLGDTVAVRFSTATASHATEDDLKYGCDPMTVRGVFEGEDGKTIIGVDFPRGAIS